jgi:hypothetical protein
MTQSKSELAAEALANATQNVSTVNYAAIFEGFAARGIPAAEIKPRENVFSYHAWRALGRQVKRGEHGVKCVTWVPMTKKNDAGEPEPIGRRPHSVSVFHVSQTEESCSN